MEFICSFCGKRKRDAENWLLGFEGTKEGSVVMKYAINLLGKWGRAASHPSERCALLLYYVPEQLPLQELR